jgi:molecular chaperone GrpE (heat shock protein)
MPEPEPKQVITERMMRDALKADEQSRTLLNRANTALTAERAAHQDTRAQLDEANKKLLEAEVTFKNLQSRLEAAQASASTAPNVVQHSTLGAGFPK